MNNLYWGILSFLIGVLVGSINWLILFTVIKKLFCSVGDTRRKNKILLALTISLKFLLILLAFYLAIVIFKFDVLYILLGFTLSMSLIIFLVKGFKV